jgi:hypothetical protein
VANHADSIGFSAGTYERPRRASFTHLGAALADCILQAGVNYRTVVRPRVERIVFLFPESATLSGTKKFIEQKMVSEFLLWTHSEKVERFTHLCGLLDEHRIEDVASLRVWLSAATAHRTAMLQIRGIGPKTVDYLSCLVGIDAIAVDRHIRGFARQAGVEIDDYDLLKQVFSSAADLLDVSRRDFDIWVWNKVSREANSVQRELFACSE